MFATLFDLAARNGLSLSPAQQALLQRYGELLRAMNQNVNLISRKDEENLATRHLLHSLLLAMPSVIGAPIPDGARVFDIGTGGGLPGIPLQIARPDLRVVMCDSIGKKIAAVQSFLGALPLPDARAICARAESLATDATHRAAYDVVVSRATAPLDELVTWTHALLKRGGTLLTLKGGALGPEIERTRAIQGVKTIVETPVRLDGFPDFERDEKKIVRVQL